MKFLLVNPTSPISRVRQGQRPRDARQLRLHLLPSLYVAAAMPADVETRIVDENVEPLDFHDDADLVGISFMTFNAPRAYAIADRFRRERGIPVIVGGYHPTLLPEEAMRHADAVCVGDAEANVPVMVEDFRAGRLQPCYRRRLPTLRGLPVPDRSLVRGRHYAPLDVVQATRGCSHRCSFCSIAAFHGNRLRTRPVEEVIAELRSLGPRILFMDDSLVGDPVYARQLFAAMAPLGKTWFSQCSVTIAEDAELLDLAVASGCRGLFIGFESLSQDSLRSWRKSVNRQKDYLSAVRRLHARGIGVFAGFVFGADGEGPDAFPATLDFLRGANVELLQATRLTPFPGTPLFDEMDRQGRITDRDWSHYDFMHVVYQPRGMSTWEIDAGVAWVLREFYRRRNIARRYLKSLRYLDPLLAFAGIVPTSIGYRDRFRRDGTYETSRSTPAPDG
jgi:radical SAM superfamily enzyme YgiQ (UPF0313 family)